MPRRALRDTAVNSKTKIEESKLGRSDVLIGIDWGGTKIEGIALAKDGKEPVSYTHLTLPTILLV